jgi:hypothetical protein
MLPDKMLPDRMSLFTMSRNTMLRDTMLPYPKVAFYNVAQQNVYYGALLMGMNVALGKFQPESKRECKRRMLLWVSNVVYNTGPDSPLLVP